MKDEVGDLRERKTKWVIRAATERRCDVPEVELGVADCRKEDEVVREREGNFRTSRAYCGVKIIEKRRVSLARPTGALGEEGRKAPIHFTSIRAVGLGDARRRCMTRRICVCGYWKGCDKAPTRTRNDEDDWFSE